MPYYVGHLGTSFRERPRDADYAADYVLAASASGPVPRAGHKLKQGFRLSGLGFRGSGV